MDTAPQARKLQVFGDPPSQAGGQPSFLHPAATVSELPSLRERTASIGLGLMPWMCLCHQLTPLQVRAPGDLSLLRKAEPRPIKSRLVNPVKPSIYCC